ncbi:MgtC/SapB family protein [Paucilactobacillus hokkaidonensis]|uniref:MgtC/SapB family protein n=1 Tax=Paucilactobacillus hokkaidonensis TaxID=1193095 RepID=UPI000B12AA0D|nr:MgtC/SapB family protein [Paucilactobacillus hokkaidonensis]
MFEVTTLHIILRLVLIILISGIIGYDREHKSRPAGIRTTMLVGVGACIIAMTQQEIAYQAIQFTIAHRNLGNVVRTDQARLICQVVSGIGFLGAGTIIVHRGDISGLTTAASLWVTAGLGIVVGMGYYEIAVISSLVVICVLMFVKRIIHVNVLLKLEVQYLNKKKKL